MPGRVAGKVAFITGAARGQGRSHAIRLAQEGADIIAVDLAGQIDSVPYPMATPSDLAETVKEVEALDRRIVATEADVRDYGALKAAVDDGVAQLGRLDIVSANAGISGYGRADELPEQAWRDMIDVNLTGEWHAAKATIPHLRAGGFLYIEEFNRAPEDTSNTLLTAMAEREVAVPRVGRVTARPTFRVIASMNPFDNVGTTRLSTSVHDRLCRLAVTYQDEESELGIVALRAGLSAEQAPAEVASALRRDAVAVTRATRVHPDVRQGSSVRGAIDLTLVGGELLGLRGIRGTGGNGPARPDDTARTAYAETVFDAMTVALSGRIHLDETVDATPESVLRQIWEDRFLLDPATAAPG